MYNTLYINFELSYAKYHVNIFVGKTKYSLDYVPKSPFYSVKLEQYINLKNKIFYPKRNDSINFVMILNLPSEYHIIDCEFDYQYIDHDNKIQSYIIFDRQENEFISIADENDIDWSEIFKKKRNVYKKYYKVCYLCFYNN